LANTFSPALMRVRIRHAPPPAASHGNLSGEAGDDGPPSPPPGGGGLANGQAARSCGTPAS